MENWEVKHIPHTLSYLRSPGTELGRNLYMVASKQYPTQILDSTLLFSNRTDLCELVSGLESTANKQIHKKCQCDREADICQLFSQGTISDDT